MALFRCIICLPRITLAYRARGKATREVALITRSMFAAVCASMVRRLIQCVTTRGAVIQITTTRRMPAPQ